MAAAAAALNPALQNRAQPGAGEYKTYFGDLHNHNAVGYAQGSLERTFEIARNHLDFFAFTPHGHWHDIGHYENNIEASLSKVSLTQSFRELAESGETMFTGDFPRESALVHRLVFAENYQTTYSVADQDRGEQVSWYYLRVVEANGQIAWSSPIWVEARRRP